MIATVSIGDFAVVFTLGFVAGVSSALIVEHKVRAIIRKCK